MSQPILSIIGSQADPKSRTVVNLLPCRIDHDGPVKPVAPFWSPQTQENGSSVAFFRGRRLEGKTLKLPDEYRGVLLEREEKTETKNGTEQQVEVVDLEADEEDEAEKMQTVREFDEVVVWGHETIADTEDDPYVRSIEEWLQLSDQIHSYPAVDQKEGK